MQKKAYTFFYFEINYLLIWSKDYLKFLYPSLNLILIIEIDDDISSQEKIYLIRGDKIDEDKYSPMLKRDDIQRV